jgi:hypothetical protein
VDRDHYRYVNHRSKPSAQIHSEHGESTLPLAELQSHLRIVVSRLVVQSVRVAVTARVERQSADAKEQRGHQREGILLSSPPSDRAHCGTRSNREATQYNLAKCD